MAAQPRVNRTWLRQGGTRRELPSWKETFETHHGIYLDKGTSLFATLNQISADEASILLGTGNLVTGVVINLVLVGLGVILLGEKVSIVNAIGIVFCILGVALISYRS
jgi:hypothetical protein